MRLCQFLLRRAITGVRAGVPEELRRDDVAGSAGGGEPGRAAQAAGRKPGRRGFGAGPAGGERRCRRKRSYQGVAKRRELTICGASDPMVWERGRGLARRLSRGHAAIGGGNGYSFRR